jgi:hypothetical protein
MLDKKYLLIVVALVCITLFFYGSQIKKDNQIIQVLPILGGLAFGLNTLVSLVSTEEVGESENQDNFKPTIHRQKQV